jgi:hypothetical protein
MKNEMTLREKRELIVSNPAKAFHEFITAENYQMFSAITMAADTTLIEVVGCFTTENSIKAKKNAMLVMVNLELI